MQRENSPALQKLINEDAIGQLRRRDGLMAVLGSEDGLPKLDWVEGVARLLADDARLEAVEEEARDIWDRGIRHIIWAGMGGSVMAARVFTGLGFCNEYENGHMAIYPLDSTDPAALNRIVRRLVQVKQIPLPGEGELTESAFLRALFNDVMMIGVAMGMTSEEPITHLQWCTELLEAAGLRPAEHLLVMALPGSYLDAFAQEHQIPGRPLQLDGGIGTGGRMSAPTTRVFLLPAALYLTHLSGKPGLLRALLQQAWQTYNLALANEHPAEHPFVQLAAALSDASTDGSCCLLLEMPEGWSSLVQWIEQLMEESLGKGGKGIVVFDEQPLNSLAPAYSESGTLHVRVATTLEGGQAEKVNAAPQAEHYYLLHQPYLASQNPFDRLAALATSFLGWQLSMALYGYLHGITFAGQPAVENYKARARILRLQSDPLDVVERWTASARENGLTLLAPQAVDVQASPAIVFAKELQRFASPGNEQLKTPYLDITLNGEFATSTASMIQGFAHTLGNELLGIPVKLRHAPAAYHSTEQSEMDGPANLVSLRLLARVHEESIIGTYTDTFLCAQAVSTWQTMLEQGRPCFLLIVDGPFQEVEERLRHFYHEAYEYLSKV